MSSEEAAIEAVTRHLLDWVRAEAAGLPDTYLFNHPGDGLARFLAETRASKCYRTASGMRVHVKPGCRCVSA